MNKVQPRTPSGFNEYLPAEQIEFDRLRDVIHSRQRVSIPISVDVFDANRVHSFPTSDTTIASFFREMD